VRSAHHHRPRTKVVSPAKDQSGKSRYGCLSRVFITGKSSFWRGAFFPIRDWDSSETYTVANKELELHQLSEKAQAALGLESGVKLQMRCETTFYMPEKCE